MFIPKDFIRFPFGFFILLDLNIFSEVIKIIQESVNHTQLKNYSGLEVIYRPIP